VEEQSPRQGYQAGYVLITVATHHHWLKQNSESRELGQHSAGQCFAASRYRSALNEQQNVC